MRASSSEKQLYLAKLAEQVEQYEDMLDFLKEANLDADLSIEERDTLFSRLQTNNQFKKRSLEIRQIYRELGRKKIRKIIRRIRN